MHDISVEEAVMKGLMKRNMKQSGISVGGGNRRWMFFEEWREGKLAPWKEGPETSGRGEERKVREWKNGNPMEWKSVWGEVLVHAIWMAFKNVWNNENNEIK